MILKSNALVLVAVLAGCTGRGPQPIDIQRPQPSSSPGPRLPAGVGGETTMPGDTEEQQNGTQTSTPPAGLPQSASAAVVFSKSQFSPAYNLANLKYQFAYLGKTQNGDITFDALGKATVTLKDLPAGQTGTVTLDVLEGTTPRMRGSKDNVTLKAGEANQIDLRLTEIGGSGQTTDLSIDVSFAGQNGGGALPPPVTPPPGPPVTPLPPQPPVAQPPTPPVPVLPTTDPIAGWDGKSNKGNSRWNIIPVTN